MSKHNPTTKETARRNTKRRLSLLLTISNISIVAQFGLGFCVRERRRELGKTQAELAAAAGLSRS